VPVIARLQSRLASPRGQDGFTLLIAIGVLFVTGLLLLAAFTAVQGDAKISHATVVQQQAYYAALSGVQEYEYKLEVNADYWEACESLASKEESGERYEVSLLAASGKSLSSCATNPYETIIESSGAEANTFRIKVTGCAGKSGLTSCPSKSEGTVEVKTLVATFRVSGFLNYVYFTQFEDIDPSLLSGDPHGCEEYYRERGADSECEIGFAAADSVSGPLHTDDAAKVQCTKSLTFGRKEHSPADVVEINGGTHPTCTSPNEPIYYTESKTYSKGAELVPPASDGSLEAYAEAEDVLEGVNELVLKGTTIEDYHWVGSWSEKTLAWPKNGLIYDKNSTTETCHYVYKATENDSLTTARLNEERPCATTYVYGTYSKSLTIGSQENIVILNNIDPTGITLGAAPTGSATLGLIATDFVRVYHPVGENESSAVPEFYIYAAILSTSHSFLVDQWTSGTVDKYLNVYGAIAQKFRGPVATANETSVTSGFTKRYTYDQRLATEEPPYFLSPLSSGWEVSRLTAPTAG
jgi:Tfp pilus assembly protein PilX